MLARFGWSAFRESGRLTAAAATAAAAAAAAAGGVGAGAVGASAAGGASSSAQGAQLHHTPAVKLPIWPTDSRERWAYPSPYDDADECGHAGPDAFVPDIGRRFLDQNRKTWRLRALVEYWQTLDDEECWPWVWCQPNPNGPHHVFVGADETLLDRCRSVTEASPRNNITIIVSDENCLKRHAPLDLYFKAGAAVIEARVEQFEVTDRVLMLDDERIICFDKCHVL
eukprot:COSAG02_NODE_1137_length_14313_cov_6.111369_7_plen_226_part_00